MSLISKSASVLAHPAIGSGHERNARFMHLPGKGDFRRKQFLTCLGIPGTLFLAPSFAQRCWKEPPVRVGSVYPMVLGLPFNFFWLSMAAPHPHSACGVHIG